MTTPAQVSRPEERSVLVTRRFAAPPARVWQAYTDPALLSRWLLGPPGWTMPVCEMDVRPGGAFRWRWREDATGTEFGFHGHFQEVEPERMMRHTEIYDPGTMGGDMGGEAIVTVTFTSVDGGTQLSTHIAYASAADCAAAVATGMTDGMETSYKGLDALLPTL